MEENKIDLSALTLFDKNWALLTSGDINNHNSMTISWGQMGTLWRKPVVTTFVRFNRHTFSFIDKNEYFVVSFFPQEFHDALVIMGTKSGKDVDKDKISNLTPIKHGEVTIYKEAKVSLVCKKIYFDDFKFENMPKEVIKLLYEGQENHRMFIGEVVEIVEK